MRDGLARALAAKLDGLYHRWDPQGLTGVFPPGGPLTSSHRLWHTCFHLPHEHMGDRTRTIRNCMKTIFKKSILYSEGERNDYRNEKDALQSTVPKER